MKPIHRNNPGLRFLIDYWSRYCPLEPWHEDWARMHVHVPHPLKKGDILYIEGEKQKNVYFVARGAVARCTYRAKSDQRQILRVALPGMALMTTEHLYSHTPSAGDIVVLRPGTSVIEISYRAIKDFKEREPHIDTLIDVLGNKKKKQMSALSLLMHGEDPFSRYVTFAQRLPELVAALTQREQAQLLGISRNTVQRAQYFLLTGQRPKN